MAMSFAMAKDLCHCSIYSSIISISDDAIGHFRVNLSERMHLSAERSLSQNKSTVFSATVSWLLGIRATAVDGH